MSAGASPIGRAKTSLIFGGENSARAVIASIVAHTRDIGAGERIRFAGSVSFEEQTARHCAGVLLPIVDAIGDSLGLDRVGFDISVTNPGAASMSDLGVEISGFSADVPLLLAMLSAALNLSIPADVVATGHIASADGDIAAVKAMPAKISGALTDGLVSHFVYPALDQDPSLASLSPRETEKAKTAVVSARGRLKLTAVGNIADLAEAVFTDEAVVVASLQKGFFAASCTQQHGASPVSLVVRFLATDNEARFWNVLERYLHSGESEETRGLILAYSKFHIRCETYPREFGRCLMQLLRSLPPVVRRLKVGFPLLPTLVCVQMSKFAAESDADDIRLLYNAVAGKGIWTEPIPPKLVRCTNEGATNATGQDVVDTVVSQIDRSALAQAIGIPIDTARATYTLDSLTVESSEQFYDCISAFYLHLQRHTHSVPQSLDARAIRAEAIALVERAFFNKGGLTAVMNEARQAVQGGMKHVLDAMTEQFKNERRNVHVNRVIKEALSPLDVNDRMSFVSALLKRLAPHLPQEITSASPKRFVEHYELIVKTYVESLDKISEAFGRL